MHFHVLAVHDLGGTQQCDHGWDDQWSYAEARQFADHVIKADTSCDEFPTPGFAYGSEDLRSCNVDPGYDAIWILGCTSAASACMNSLFGRDRNGAEPHWLRA